MREACACADCVRLDSLLHCVSVLHYHPWGSFLQLRNKIGPVVVSPIVYPVKPYLAPLLL